MFLYLVFPYFFINFIHFQKINELKLFYSIACFHKHSEKNKNKKHKLVLVLKIFIMSPSNIFFFFHSSNQRSWITYLGFVQRIESRHLPNTITLIKSLLNFSVIFSPCTFKCSSWIPKKLSNFEVTPSANIL